MEFGWECKKCHNIYAPYTPFCIYCWINNNNNNNKAETPITNNQQKIIINPNISTKEIKETTKQNILNDTNDITLNKNLNLEYITEQIPVTNKIPNCLPSDKWPDTKIFLSGIGSSKERAIHRTFKVPYILDSIVDMPITPSKLVRNYFDYIKNNNIEYLLDSGAFTYMNNPKKDFNLQEHLQRYCYYINEFDIQNFFELDLDVFMSLEDIENIRRKIYLETHKKPIIVHHFERGQEYWLKTCKENELIAIGGLAINPKYKNSENWPILLEKCEEAHSYNTKVHGLGFTPLTLLNSHTMFFDTVDSTTWNYSKRGYSASLNEQGEIIKIPLRTELFAIDSVEEDLKTWATFATNYKGASRLSTEV